MYSLYIVVGLIKGISFKYMKRLDLIHLHIILYITCLSLCSLCLLLPCHRYRCFCVFIINHSLEVWLISCHTIISLQRFGLFISSPVTKSFSVPPCLLSLGGSGSSFLYVFSSLMNIIIIFYLFNFNYY